MPAADAARDPAISSTIYDFTAGDKLPRGASHDWTLGPTGARGWCQIGKGLASEGNTRPSRQILITQVSSGTPASGVLQKGDVIVGIGDQAFSSDARIAFAKALGTAQAADGQLVLQRFRQGKTEQVSITLPKLPAFSATAPYDCEKSRILFDQGCEALSKRGLKRTDIPTHINALALLASGEEKYMEQLKDYAHRMVSRPVSPEIGLPCWHFAFANLFLSEYYLVTNDQKVLPEIKRLSKYLVDGRGPLSTWGHSFVDPTNHRLRGYGAVNAVGVPVVMSLTLARECGVDVPNLDKCITESAHFFRRHVGLGAIPYGDGPPTTQYGHDDNGKNSASALFFNFLEDSRATKYYTRTAMASYGSDREQGHTGNFFNMFWSLPAVALGGPEATGMWLKEFGWYYDLARDPQHRYPYQGYPNEREGSAHSGWDCPGAYLLHLALPRKVIRLTGKKGSSIEAFTAEENKENMDAGRTSYKGASEVVLKKALTSWSPVARIRAEKELRKRKLLEGGETILAAKDPIVRIAAVNSLKDYEICTKMLDDEDLRVRIAAMQASARLDKPRAVEAVFSHLVRAKGENPVFTQKLGDIFFPLGSRGKQIGDLLNGIKDRKVAVQGVMILLDDEDALVSSRVAMGVRYLPKDEQVELLPKIYQRATEPPAGNVMFANGLRVSCVEVLASMKLKEGLEIAADLVAENSWGRNARIPRAAAVVASYQGHAKSVLPVLNKAAAAYGKGDNKWKALIEQTAKKIESAPTTRDRLKTIKNFR
ncbi:PDZ domain-containing protein [Verrucomicrobiaceae bacterium R5-34]|uniref:PDZ domain-containing protein n=1 Tax=Oceaniferula flava TaxID=2800421 RepID=A0AAE2VCD6_9BACT|nr:DUF6288 domain-containing protein [Oceaniferula flavus]MBK1831038.1 PDZ domain-containing protein [Verrucomicrobiaceae bacterium R5-34]MBK1855555.1 PDZ domain-containing protein [Oceaniferula flavus]MBM1136861.1 PDZ domain-containing protein [Oceaniferula flavus]